MYIIHILIEQRSRAQYTHQRNRFNDRLERISLSDNLRSLRVDISNFLSSRNLQKRPIIMTGNFNDRSQCEKNVRLSRRRKKKEQCTNYILNNNFIIYMDLPPFSITTELRDHRFAQLFLRRNSECVPAECSPSI